MKTTILLLRIIIAGLLCGACATPKSGPTNMLPTSPAVTKERAIVVALAELQRRDVHLPSGYATKVTEDYFCPEAAPAIPTYTVSFLASRASLGRGVRRLEMYAVAVNRNNGEVHHFFDLLKLRPVEDYTPKTPHHAIERAPKAFGIDDLGIVRL